MALDDIKAMDRETITPAIAAQVLGMDPHFIRIAARQRPDLLGFPTIVYNSRTKIPRRAFIKFMEGEGNPHT